MKNNNKQAKFNKRKISGERIQKKLANLGFGSRREIERLIEAGLVKVNNKPATLGQHLIGNELIQIKGRKVVLSDIRHEKKTRVIAYHKPLGVLCTRKDEQNRPTVFKDLPPLRNARWVMVGRLDANTSGLLLFTNNGKLANDLMHPSGAHFDNIIAISPDDEAMNNHFKVTLHEGRNREVRRLWEAVDCQVSRLKRIRYGSYEIPKRLKQGKTVELTSGEIQKLSKLLKKTTNTD